MKLKDIIMSCRPNVVIMKNIDEVLEISTRYCNAMMMLSENFLESNVKRMEPDGNRIKIWLESEE